MNNINSNLHKFKISTKVLSFILCAILSASLIGVSFAFFRVKNDVKGSIFLSAGLVAEVENLSTGTISDLKQEKLLNLYVKSIQKDFTANTTQTLFEYEPNTMILNSEENVYTSAGDVITLYNPTIRAGKGSRGFYLRSMFYAFTLDDSGNENKIAPQNLVFYNFKSIPNFSSNWVLNNNDNYYYNVKQNVTEYTGVNDLYLNFYNSETDRSNLIKFFDDNSKIEINTINFDDSKLGQKVYFKLVIEFIEAEDADYINKNWKI